MKITAVIIALFIAFAWRAVAADGPVAPNPLTTLACRDREDPTMGATLVFDLGRHLLVRSTNIGPTILFDDRDVRVHVDAGAIEWEVAHNTYTLNRATLELDVTGRVYVCQVARNQI